MCGGTRTEFDYFLGLRRVLRNPTVRVKVVAKGVAPDQLVRHAKRIGDGYDELWCVVDTDEFDIAKAARLADELGCGSPSPIRASSCGCCFISRTIRGAARATSSCCRI